MNKTKIEWVKNPDGSQGYTWNPITGCLNGCPYCYARKLANGRLKGLYQSNINVAPSGYLDLQFADPFYPRFWSERLDEIKPSGTWWDTLRGRKPRGIFVCDMSELFGDWIPKEWQKQVFDAIESDPLDRFYLLTKQPQNLIKWSPFPKNCWVGVTATNELQFQKAMKYLPYVQATVRYLSIEPFLGRILTTPGQLERYINWLIIGAQTKPYKPPQIEWVEEIIEATDKAGKPVFQKDNLKPLLGNNLQQEIPK